MHYPEGTEKNDDNVEPQHYGQQLSLQRRKAKALDDNPLECPQAGGGECSRERDGSIAPDLRISQSLNELVLLEGPVLHAGLVLPNTFDQEVLILFGKAVGPHGAIWHIPADKQAEEDGEDAINKKDTLP